MPDALCKRFKDLAKWQFNTESEREGRLVGVEILGHIFEQSIADLEEMHRAMEADPPDKVGPSKRKKEGAFYTPAFVTRYIVEETLGPVIHERFERSRLDILSTHRRLVFAGCAQFATDVVAQLADIGPSER